MLESEQQQLEVIQISWKICARIFLNSWLQTSPEARSLQVQNLATRGQYRPVILHENINKMEIYESKILKETKSCSVKDYKESYFVKVSRPICSFE